MALRLEEFIKGPRLFTMINPPRIHGALLDEILLVVNGDACRITEDRIRKNDKRALKATRVPFKLHQDVAMLIAPPRELGTVQLFHPDDSRASMWGEYELKEHNPAILGKLTPVSTGLGWYAFDGQFPDSGNGQ